MSSQLCCDLLFIRNQDAHFSEPIHKCLQVIRTFPWHRKPSHKIHRHTFPWMRRYQEWSVHAQYFVTLLTSSAIYKSLYIFGYSFIHPRPIKIPLKLNYSLNYTKMTRYKRSMSFSNYMNSFTQWNTKFSKMIQ